MHMALLIWVEWVDTNLPLKIKKNPCFEKSGDSFFIDIPYLHTTL